MLNANRERVHFIYSAHFDIHPHSIRTFNTHQLNKDIFETEKPYDHGALNKYTQTFSKLIIKLRSGCVSKNASGTSNINCWTVLKPLRSTRKSTDTLKSQGREFETFRRLEEESRQGKSEIYNKTIPLRTL